MADCATHPTAAAQRIKDAGADMVKGCQFLGAVTGFSSLAPVVSATGVSNAKTVALEKAVGLGATRIVWATIAGSYGYTDYRCQL